MTTHQKIPRLSEAWELPLKYIPYEFVYAKRKIIRGAYFIPTLNAITPA